MPKTPFDREIIQDFTQIKDVGDSLQQNAGHIPRHSSGGYNEPGSSWANLLAYYKFASGDLLSDEKGDYDLTDHNTAINAVGIMGTNYAVDFNGTDQYYSQGTLLDSTSTLSNGIAIDFWFKADDGQPGAAQYIFRKINITDEDSIGLNIQTDGLLRLVTEENNNGFIYNYSSTILPNGATDWYYIVINWDTTNGLRMWINGILEIQDSTQTTLMLDGTDADFSIGASSGGASYFGGQIAQFRVRDQIITQKDVDLAYATEYAVPASFSGTEAYNIVAHALEDGDSEFESQISWGGLEITRNDNYIYRYGGLFDSNDELKLEIRS